MDKLLEELQWRTGRKVGRTIYAVSGGQSRDDDQLIGMMDTPELARAAVRAHNDSIMKRWQDEEPLTAKMVQERVQH